MITNSPFIIVHDFISPLVCEYITDLCVTSDINTISDNTTLSDIVLSKLNDISPEIESKYNISIDVITNPIINIVPQDTITKASCDNSRFLRGKWLQTEFIDISGVIFFNDSNYTLPFEHSYEVYGGKLEFPQHAFGFNSTRGVLILYPSGPHFIHKFTTPEIGDLHYAQFNIKSQERFIYQPSNFPGDYTNWFINDI